MSLHTCPRCQNAAAQTTCATCWKPRDRKGYAFGDRRNHRGCKRRPYGAILCAPTDGHVESTMKCDHCGKERPGRNFSLGLERWSTTQRGHACDTCSPQVDAALDAVGTPEIALISDMVVDRFIRTLERLDWSNVKQRGNLVGAMRRALAREKPRPDRKWPPRIESAEENCSGCGHHAVLHHPPRLDKNGDAIHCSGKIGALSCGCLGLPSRAAEVAAENNAKNRAAVEAVWQADEDHIDAMIDEARPPVVVE